MGTEWNVKGYIFDYGGTLDTGGHHWGQMLWHAYRQTGVPVTEQRFREAYVEVERFLGKNPVIESNYTFRQTLSEKIKRQLQAIDASGGLQAFHAPILDNLYAEACRHTRQSRDVLVQLKEHYRLVLVSNFYGNLTTVLREFHLDGLFSKVIESAVVGVRKPDPHIFLLGVEALGLAPAEVAVVGDSMEKDLIPAKAVGCQTVWLKGEGWTAGRPAENSADRVITDLKELLA